ncbi:hypothetical protein BCR33DRAFT_479951 [Rhizoclosmatium globosum]|uniref:Swiss Army Knife RNA repair protein HAD domain-containing protein n=1 Tax=Rhizoclosmatium globosum TaxID=329046 RepID=A0A1Y2BNH7_9FUNG|nr:hypothetical protein BCR33DRAFT_479951 [Rhizoclosmatium globosum]|eukprot:ORY36296.1 hypothetical protein BCR33DRAFT_479951 [Rhizoclosmatium globosum]
MTGFIYEQLTSDFAKQQHQQHSPSIDSNPTQKSTRLAVFDFDSTLFRSPLPNPNIWSNELRGSVISDCAWFLEPRTLSPPYIPDTPDFSWWDARVVQSVLDLLKRREDGESVLIVLLTGRRHDLFHDRISELCRGLSDHVNAGAPLFDIMFLKELHNAQETVTYETTLDYKWAVLMHLFSVFPGIRSLEIWDDRQKHLDIFEKKLELLKCSGRLELIQYHNILQEPDLEKYLPEDLEYALVMELIDKCNARTLAATERETVKVLSPVDSVVASKLIASTESKASPIDTMSSDFLECLDCSATTIPESVPKPLTPKEKRKASKANTPRKSISCFRSVINVTEQVSYTGVFLSTDATKRLVEAIPMPTEGVYSTKAHHVTVSLGKAKDEILQPLGGLGAKVEMKAVAVGSYKGVVAVKIELDWKTEGECPRISTNETPHVTMYVGAGCKAKESNFITEWTVLDPPIPVDGVITEKKVYGLKNTKPVEQKAKDISIGGLIKQYHPHLKGKEVGEVVKKVQEWMDKTYMDNSSHNAPEVELFISNLVFEKVE